MKKALLITTAAVAAMLTPGVAHAAETPPGCPEARQIGSTAHVTFGNDETMASVKQFAGCGKNWGYVFVWQSWAAKHDLFHVSASVVTNDNVAHGKVTGRVNQREVWSKPTDTINRCTRALGRVALGEDGWSAYSSKVC